MADLLQINYPCLCLCLAFVQITTTRPLRRTVLQSLQIFLALALTFINYFKIYRKNNNYIKLFFNRKIED